ncbi:uncharacterized protein PODANS_3_4880 [Podospora anserina S mat+]|uniref:Podospora anserina S mat+ genomic DNA chromosome 3, supercontig 2 n=1 Tax=Podospora anserina (strain S / ATCC MYA-4624 / DSM 980 / FGSC 10383) TaxID=515849 RepID=B2AZM1_PODAN|nr:uncharacterized protein PODANS_3_4880 [Podospora anserina S mat+]CAP70409.1 unnamed protein product [Podospora anserina S mat+]
MVSSTSAGLTVVVENVLLATKLALARVRQAERANVCLNIVAYLPVRSRR